MVSSTPQRRRSNEAGIALVMALLGIVLIGALVTGTVFAGRLEMASGRNAIYTAQATEAAEAGLADAFNPWNSNWNSTTTYPLETSVAQTTVYPVTGNSSVRYSNTVRRLKGGTYMITSLGEKLDAGGNVLASRWLAQLGKLVVPDVSITAAVTSVHDTEINGAAFVDGRNYTPTGWTGCGAFPDKSAVRTAGVVDGNHPNSVAGSSPVKQEHDGTVTTALVTGPFNSFLPLKTITLGMNVNVNGVGPATSGSPAVCDKTLSDNWGEPRRGGGTISQCYNYFPIIYAPGNLRVNNTVGQGILLVGGDLDLHGNFNFYGVIIVLGSFTTSGTDNVYGAVLVADNFVGDDTSIGGNVVVEYSGCSVATALSGSASGVPLTERKWAQLTPR